MQSYYCMSILLYVHIVCPYYCMSILLYVHITVCLYSCMSILYVHIIVCTYYCMYILLYVHITVCPYSYMSILYVHITVCTYYCMSILYVHITSRSYYCMSIVLYVTVWTKLHLGSKLNCDGCHMWGRRCWPFLNTWSHPDGGSHSLLAMGSQCQFCLSLDYSIWMLILGCLLGWVWLCGLDLLLCYSYY